MRNVPTPQSRHIIRIISSPTRGRAPPDLSPHAPDRGEALSSSACEHGLPLYQVALWLTAWLSACLTITRACAFVAPHYHTAPYRMAHTHLCELSARELVPIRAVGGVRRHAAVYCSALAPIPDSSFAVREAGEGRGLGLFTTVPIEESTFLFDYVGHVLPAQEYAERFSGLSEYILSIDNASGYTFIIDAQDPEVSNLARYMNHAKMGLPSLPRLGLVATGPCNCIMLSESSETYAKFVEAELDNFTTEQMPPPRLHVFTLRAIAAGEELCWDYGEEYWAMMAKRGIFQAAVE